MCGIFGFVTTSGNSGLSREVVENCLQVISHRGPDARGIDSFSSAKVSGLLGHVRLSIIDLSGGKQPMADTDGNILLSFNGEIYNYLSLKQELISSGHEFSQQSDTEVLLHAYQEWGISCVSRLRGMFAFAIWDARIENLFLARDQFGKKPLFYTYCKGVLYFCSEIKGLKEIPGLRLSFNKSQLTNYTIYRYVPSPSTFINEINKLPAGSYLAWSKDNFSIHRYFTPSEASPITTSMSEDQATKKFWAILDESVRLRMAADVPFGAFLSGGIDSSAVVALMSQHSDKKIKTFSIGFSEGEYSEIGYARVIADHFNTEHHEFVVSQEDLMELLPEVIRYRDAPVCEPSDVPIFILAKNARKFVKMVLTGEGSDEILGGYPKHTFERFIFPFHLIPGLIRHRILDRIVSALPYRFHRAKTALRNMNIESFDERMPGWFGAITIETAKSLIKLTEQAALPQLVHSAGRGRLHDILLFDQSSWLPDNLLERGDRMTMASSLEARMPFMDIELAKFAASLPDHYRIRGMTTKYILRKAMVKVLPSKILERPKVGFRVPVNVWFQTYMKDFLLEQLLGADSISKRFYEISLLNTLVREHIDGRQNNEKVLWMLLNLEIWLRQNQHVIDF